MNHCSRLLGIACFLAASTAGAQGQAWSPDSQRVESVRTAELERFHNRLAALDPAQRETVEALTKGIVAKLLHQVSVRLKDDAGTPQGARNAAAVRELFDLG